MDWRALQRIEGTSLMQNESLCFSFFFWPCIFLITCNEYHWILFIKNYLTIKLDRIVEQWLLIVTNARGRQWTKD